VNQNLVQVSKLECDTSCIYAFFSFRAFPKEYSNFESVNIITMFNRFKFKEVVKHVYGDAPKMFKCLKSNRLNLFC